MDSLNKNSIFFICACRLHTSGEEKLINALHQFCSCQIWRYLWFYFSVQMIFILTNHILNGSLGLVLILVSLLCSEDDLSLLAHQTELFALRNRHLNNVTTSPDPLSSSSRSSSYSSIVSSSSNNGGATAGNDLNRPPKINKGSAFTPITDFRTPPPPLGNKNMVSIKPNMASGMKVKASPWPITATSPAGGDIR